MYETHHHSTGQPIRVAGRMPRGWRHTLAASAALAAIVLGGIPSPARCQTPAFSTPLWQAKYNSTLR